jgi:hypothetical protein
MVVGTLPWPTIQKEVVQAVKDYMAETHGQNKNYIQVQFLTDFIYRTRYPERYPHFQDAGWQTIKTRCRTAMVKMGWEQFSLHAFVIPYGEKGGILFNSEKVKA